ncbi:NAD(P)-dependent oxidoreductase [Patescibacteria group bacterium]|nr:NAD(P)-dependent oxidoreductase [Patescibacteria group bacterium]MCL5010040.1 NAD(P)-dependent oxidoreductase [Patescibacteria group bacterium]
MQKVLITGGCGFLGVHLARRLLQEKYNVTLLDIASLEAKDLIGKVTVIKGDVRNKSLVGKALRNQDYVVHAAAALPIQRSKKIIFGVNINGTKNVLEASLKNKVKRLVFISSTAVYGVPNHLPEKETDRISPIGYYGQSKAEGEKLCLRYGEKGLSVNIIRPKTFLGPERLGVFTIWFEAIYNGKKLFILGSGNNKYQLLAVSDVIEAIVKALKTKTDRQIFNIGAQEFKTWRKDLEYVIKYAKSRTKIISLPVFPSQMMLRILELLNLSPVSAWHYKTLPVNSYVDTKNAEKILGWKATKSNQQLLLENYKWYESHRNEFINQSGKGHRVGWNFKLLGLVTKFT